jgi:release factor glutamine methyltransferase
MHPPLPNGPAPAPDDAAASLAEALREARRQLMQAGQAAARMEAELLLCAAALIPRTTLYAWPERRLDAAQTNRLRALLQRRLGGEPMAYILGHRAFHAVDLVTAPGALIPRPETELLVDWALQALPADAPLRCADLGTGTGAIAIALAAARPAWTLLAVEREPAALAVARQNLARSAHANVALLRGDWLSAFAPASLEAVISNPPYVCAGDPHLRRGDLRFEPAQALAGGRDGLDPIRRIVAQAMTALRPGGLLLLEHGWQQGAAVRALLQRRRWCAIVTHRDLAGLERATGARRPQQTN